jgi:hypothetical protein
LSRLRLSAWAFESLGCNLLLVVVLDRGLCRAQARFSKQTSP